MAYGVAVDSADNIIVTGTFGLNQVVTGVNLGGGLLSGLGGQNIFVAKYSSAGAYVWAKSFGGPFSNYGYAIAVDGNDDIFVGGNFYAGPIDFGGGALYGTATDVFLLKLNSAGAYVWAKSYGGVGEQNLRSLAVDRAGGVIVAGYYAGTANFGAGPVTSRGSAAGFLAKYSAVDGTARWSKIFLSTNLAAAYGVAADPNNGDVVVTGCYGSGTDFGGGALTTAGTGTGMFVARYDSQGNYAWAKGYGGAYNCSDIAQSVVIDGSGRVAVTGQVQSEVNFGSGWLWGNGMQNFFILDLDSSGRFRWVKRCDSTIGASCGTSASLDPSGTVITAGWFSGTVDFGGGAVNSGTVSKASFLAKYAP